MEPRAVRPLYNEYLIVSYVLRTEKEFYSLTEQQFLDKCMEYSKGSMNPKRVLTIYDMLMEEAGL